MLSILIYFTFFTLLGLLSYYLIFSCLSLPQKLNDQSNKVDKITLIICAKNELTNLKEHLAFWLNQVDIEFELLVVNDHSTDGSKEWLEQETGKYKNLKVLHLGNHDDAMLKGKRYALQQGIALATHDFIVLSDADCFPTSNRWLRQMANGFSKGKEIVLGYSPYLKEDTLLNKLIAYETLMTAIQYLSFSKMGYTYMGVGRNIAYKKSILTNEAFLESNVTMGGDDDLMVLQLATKKNVAVQLIQESFVYSKPERSFSAWFKQKQRHYSTAKHYPTFLKLMVGGLGALNILFYIALFTLLFTEINLIVPISLYLLKNMSFGLFNLKNLINLKETKVIFYILYLDLMYSILLIYNHTKALKVRNGWS